MPRGAQDAGAVIRPGSVADAGRAGDLHASQISGGFLSFLGPRFLARLYRRIVRRPSSFLLVAEDHGQVVGFIAGSDDVRGFYRTFLLHDGFGAAVTTAPRLVRGWRRVLETLRHGTGTASGTGRGIELLAVAVDPDDQGRGIGADLVDAFLAQVRADGGQPPTWWSSRTTQPPPPCTVGPGSSRVRIRAARRNPLADDAVGRRSRSQDEGAP